MTPAIVTVTSKGQATIPSKLRKKHGTGRKVLVIDTEAGVLLKPVPDPALDKGSLKELFGGTGSRELIDEARSEELRRDLARIQR
jgi:AbrB family looped-hinge helix DNA binding protein